MTFLKLSVRCDKFYLCRHVTARWPSGLRRNVKVSLIYRLPASVVFGRGFESHSCHTFFPHFAKVDHVYFWPTRYLAYINTSLSTAKHVSTRWEPSEQRWITVREQVISYIRSVMDEVYQVLSGDNELEQLQAIGSQLQRIHKQLNSRQIQMQNDISSTFFK